jgi:hypothetical protein
MRTDANRDAIVHTHPELHLSNPHLTYTWAFSVEYSPLREHVHAALTSHLHPRHHPHFPTRRHVQILVPLLDHGLQRPVFKDQ